MTLKDVSGTGFQNKITAEKTEPQHFSPKQCVTLQVKDVFAHSNPFYEAALSRLHQSVSLDYV